MTGPSDLENLIGHLDPLLAETEYVFLHLPASSVTDHASLEPLATFMEREGLTLIVPRERADDGGHSYEGCFRMITLQVRSSLHGVGLTAAVSQELASIGIPVNMVAAFHHDHLFVPGAHAERAMASLKSLSARHRR